MTDITDAHEVVELKPCPFCETEMHQHANCFSHPMPKDGDCFLRHYSFDNLHRAAWNTRTSQAELVSALEALAEASDACDPRYEETPGRLQELSNQARALLARVKGDG